MQKKLLWKIGGEAGFGIMTTGLVFSKIAARQGHHIFDYIEYPSLIRGGHNTYEVIVSDEVIGSSKSEIDILICLNKATFTLHKSRLTKNSIVIYDKEEFTIEGEYRLVNLPFKQILKNESGVQIMINNIALGATMALMGWDLDVLENAIEEEFAKKDQKIIEKNKKMGHAGFYHIKNLYAHLANKNFPKIEKFDEKMIVTGNESHSLGSVIGDCKFHASYPMTPASSVLSVMAGLAQEVGMVVRHAEDEISVINTALGASFAGARSSVATSGGGFALMTEAISMAGICEIPVVIFLAQRPGPATGMPTWTEQADLLFAIHAGHGEFPKIVLAPGDVEEMYQLTAKAFNLADIYQTPVIVLSDKLLSEGHQSMSKSKFLEFAKSFKINRGKIVSTADEGYLRYAKADDGISPMLIPNSGQPIYQANSYEHLEDGHTTESSAERIKQVNKREKKIATYLKNDFAMPEIFGDEKKAETVIVSWGSNKGAIIDAMKMTGKKIAYVHFNHIYPLDKAKLAKLFKSDKKYLLIENNHDGQLGKLLHQEIGVEFADKLLKYDGRPIYVEEILHKLSIINFQNSNELSIYELSN